MELFKEQFGFIIAITGGLVVSIMTSQRHSFWVASARLSAGLFCSTVLTDPFVHYMDLESAFYRNCIAGLFAMTGYAITRVISNIDKETFFEIIRIIRGAK